MKETTTLTWKLLLICAVVAALLAYVNQVTAPIIETNNQAAFMDSMSEVLPDGKPFSEVNPKEVSAFTPSETGVTLDSLYQSEKGGFVATATCSEGYGGAVTIMVGITPEQKVEQIKVLTMSETPGLGAKADTPAFSQQYHGLEQGIAVIKNRTATGNEIQAISGATITSKAVTKAVNAALEATKALDPKGGTSK